jgi:hypothetical protein
MNFKRIGWSEGGGNVNNFVLDDSVGKSNLNFITECDAEITKGSDITEPNALDLVTDWQYSIKNKNGLPIYDKFRRQHYRIYNSDTKPAEDDLINIIKDSYEDFKLNLDKINSGITLYPLDCKLIQNTLDKLKKLF